MKLLFDFDRKKCSACGACAVACMDQNDVDVEGGQQPYRKIDCFERDGELFSLSVACLHCSDAPCAAACPVGVLYKDAETGLTRYDNADCIGCRACARACPYDAPTFRPVDGNPHRVKMEKCHGCATRIEAGLTPACVRACPTHALTRRWAEEDEVSPLAALLNSMSE
jgi:Fe-S-cluster-containing dehydrogenase component